MVLFCCGLMSAWGQYTTQLKGRVVDTYGNPVENVLITTAHNSTTIFSKAEGEFSITIPVNRETGIHFQHPSYRDTTLYVKVARGTDTSIVMVLATNGEMLDGLTVTDKYADSYTRIDPKASFTMPTPSGGVESLIKSMPGASSTNELSNQYNVRGGNYDENLVFVNDIQIYRPFLVRSAQQEGMGFVNLDLAVSRPAASRRNMATRCHRCWMWSTKSR